MFNAEVDVEYRLYYTFPFYNKYSTLPTLHSIFNPETFSFFRKLETNVKKKKKKNEMNIFMRTRSSIKKRKKK